MRFREASFLLAPARCGVGDKAVDGYRTFLNCSIHPLPDGGDESNGFQSEKSDEVMRLLNSAGMLRSRPCAMQDHQNEIRKRNLTANARLSGGGYFAFGETNY